MVTSSIVSGGLRSKGKYKFSNAEFPLVSIITVVFNGEKHLEQTILSLINQTYSNIEYIIIDAGSTDGTLEIIKKHEENIDYWVSEPDNGIYDAMNKGIALSKGELIGILNSDDWYEEYTIIEIVNKFKNNPEIDIFHGLHKLWNKNGLLGIIGHTDLYLQYGMISHPTCFVKKEVYENYGGFDSIYKISADYELMLRFKSKSLKFFMIEKTLVNFRNDGISNTSRKQIVFETNEIQWKYSIISAYKMRLNKFGFLFRSFFVSK